MPCWSRRLCFSAVTGVGVRPQGQGFEQRPSAQTGRWSLADEFEPWLAFAFRALEFRRDDCALQVGAAARWRFDRRFPATPTG